MGSEFEICHQQNLPNSSFRTNKCQKNAGEVLQTLGRDIFRDTSSGLNELFDLLHVNLA